MHCYLLTSPRALSTMLIIQLLIAEQHTPCHLSYKTCTLPIISCLLPPLFPITSLQHTRSTAPAYSPCSYTTTANIPPSTLLTTLSSAHSPPPPPQHTPHHPSPAHSPCYTRAASTQIVFCQLMYLIIEHCLWCIILRRSCLCSRIQALHLYKQFTTA